MGQAILDAIKTGLGLISDIAKELLNGFTTLFWDPGTGAEGSTGQLTVLGNFALIFLGIAISFAVVKLALNLIRANTGV